MTTMATQYITTEGSVFDMEEDLHKPGNLLFVDQFSIKTTDGVTTSVVVGSGSEHGYMDGVGEAARFRTIFGFKQLSKSQLLVADSGNHCLRFVDRGTSQTSLFIGIPEQSGFVNGPGARAQFNFPYALMWLDESSLLISDCFNNAIRMVDMKTKEVSTFIADMPTPKGMLMDAGGEKFYVCTAHSVAVVDIASKTYKVLTSAESGYQNGPIATSKFDWPTNLAWLESNTLVVADNSSDQENTQRIRIISLEKDEVTSTCPSVSPLPDQCPYYNVQSVLKSGDTLYIGGDGSINTRNLCDGMCRIL